MRTSTILRFAPDRALRRGLVVALLSATPAWAAGPPDQGSGREALVIVKGVATPFSVFGLLKRFNQIPGVARASFDLSTGLADVRLRPGAEVTDAQLRDAIIDASYTPGDIRWQPAPQP